MITAPFGFTFLSTVKTSMFGMKSGPSELDALRVVAGILPLYHRFTVPLSGAVPDTVGIAAVPSLLFVPLL